MRTITASLAIAAALLAASASARTIQPPQSPAAEDAAPVRLAVAETPTATLSTASGIRTLLADPRAKDILVRHAPQVVDFFASGQGDGISPGDTPLDTIASLPLAQDAGLTPANMKTIAAELAAL
jgi:hypothetical protein